VPAQYNDRNHRLDTLSFFTRSLRHRITGGNEPNGDTPFIATMTATEAWVWFGHLRLANSVGSLTAQQDPGIGTIGVNSNNLYSSQWAFGRVAMLLSPEEAGKIRDKSNVAQVHINSGTVALGPLAVGSPPNAGPGTFTIQSSRYDLAGTTISDYRSKLSTYLSNPANANVAWWDQLFSGNSIAVQNGTLTTARFSAVPFVKKPITPADVAQLSPIFLANCSSVTIEYAGDYLEQNNDISSGTFGVVTAVYKPANPGPNVRAATDGRIDYIALPRPTGVPLTTPQQTRIRWYGMPRNANGSKTTAGALTIPGWVNGRTSNDLTEVVPLRDVWRTYQPEAFNQVGAPFEKNTSITMPPKADYYGAGGMVAGNDYTCAWGPSDPKPKMIRLILTIDDPLGRTPSGQTFEYVFTLP
jgi:hypothetical protein